MLRSLRSGFTLIELLVVIVIISILVGLLLPAVQSAREAARCTHCKNNLKQLALAVNQFQGTKKRLPRYWGKDSNINGNWFVHILPYVEQDAIYELISEGGGDFGSHRVLVQPASPDYKPGHRDCSNSTWVPSNEPVVTVTVESGGKPSTHVGHNWEEPPVVTTKTTGGGGSWVPPCKSVGGVGTPAVYATIYDGIDAYSEKIFEVLQCPSDPYKDGKFGVIWRNNRLWSVSNYSANWHAFSDGDDAEAPFNQPIRLEELSDGTSNIVMFGETYSYCDGYYRFAFWGDCRRLRQYPSHNFGLNWYAAANTYFFQHLPPKEHCNNWRLQGLHPGGCNVAMADGSVRTLRYSMSHQEMTDPKYDRFGSGDPKPFNLAEAKKEGLEFGVWDRILLPKDGEAVQLYDAASAAY